MLIRTSLKYLVEMQQVQLHNLEICPMDFALTFIEQVRLMLAVKSETQFLWDHEYLRRLNWRRQHYRNQSLK